MAHREDAPPGARQAGDPERTRTSETMAADPEVPRERTSRMDAEAGFLRSSYSLKNAAYLSRSSGAARKQTLYAAADSSFGFGQAPPAAQLHQSEALIGEGSVSRTWRFQGSRPVVVNGILYDTTGDRLAKRFGPGRTHRPSKANAV